MLKKWDSAGNLHDLLTPCFLKKKNICLIVITILFSGTKILIPRLSSTDSILWALRPVYLPKIIAEYLLCLTVYYYYFYSRTYSLLNDKWHQLRHKKCDCRMVWKWGNKREGGKIYIVELFLWQFHCVVDELIYTHQKENCNMLKAVSTISLT